MAIFKVLVPSGPQILLMDAIGYQGGIWLVPAWLDQPTEGLIKPMRIIRVDQLPRGPAPQEAEAAFALLSPVPKALLDPYKPPAPDSGFDVRDLPPILLNEDGSPSDRGVTVKLPRQ